LLSTAKHPTYELDKRFAVHLLDRILSLHAMKGWLREVVVEVLLEFFAQLAISITQSCTEEQSLPLLDECLDGVADLLNVSIAEMAAWQVVLRLGFQHLASLYPILKSRLLEKSDVLSKDVALSINDMDGLSGTLLAATAGFPKVRTPL
jgi:site-specific recombinase XerC